MREEFILGIKFIVLIMVTHNSTLLGTLPPIPTNDSLFELEHPLIPPRCFSASTLEANGWPIQSNGCSIQSINFVPRSPSCVCCFSSPPSSCRLAFCRGVRSVYGAAERRHAAPAAIGDSFACCVVLVSHSAWFLTQNSGFGLQDGRRRRNRAPPQTPLVLRTGNRNRTWISISVYLRFQIDEVVTPR